MHSLSLASILFLAKRGLYGRSDIGKVNVDGCPAICRQHGVDCRQLKKLDKTLTRWEMKINWEKTELMKVGNEREIVVWNLGTEVWNRWR